MRVSNSIFLSFFATSGEAFKYFMVGKKNGPWFSIFCFFFLFFLKKRPCHYYLLNIATVFSSTKYIVMTLT